MQDRLLYPLPEAIQLLATSRSKLYELIAEGKIRAVKVGTRTLIPRDELERFVTELSEPLRQEQPPAA